ncbi:MAG: hypothetical protein AABY08_02085, partial [Candidatus Thermoplasmatota archaeon]
DADPHEQAAILARRVCDAEPAFEGRAVGREHQSGLQCERPGFQRHVDRPVLKQERPGRVLGIIGELDADGKGASWDAMVARAAKDEVDKDAMEEVVNSLLDKGLIYEPILGRMKKI